MLGNRNIPPSPVFLKPEDLIPDRAPGELQADDEVPAEHMPGFDQAEVYFTLEKKKLSKFLKKNNQDNILVDPETGLMGVMDGLGGMGNGDLASLVCEQVMPEEFAKALQGVRQLEPKDVAEQLLAAQGEKLRSLPDEGRRRQEAEKMIKAIMRVDPELAVESLALIRALQAANGAIKDAGGMTTACLGLIHKARNGKRYAIVANIGDSAAYIRRADGRVERLTHEDSVYDSLMRYGIKIDGLDIKDYIELHSDPLSGKIAQNLNIPIPITPESCLAVGFGPGEYEKRMKNGETVFNWGFADIKTYVTSTLGGKIPPMPSLEIVEMKPGEELLFCTDGLVDKFEDPQSGETDLTELGLDLAVGNTPEERLDNLRAMTRQRRTYKHDDDIAIVMARVK